MNLKAVSGPETCKNLFNVRYGQTIQDLHSCIYKNAYDSTYTGYLLTHYPCKKKGASGSY